MKIDSILKILYIRGYFKDQPSFLEKLLKGSVNEENKVSFSESYLKGLFVGNDIDEQAPMLIEAGFTEDNNANYIKSLYPLKHIDSDTYNKRFGEKTYQDALYENIKDNYSNEFSNINKDDMAEKIAFMLYNIIYEAYTNYQTKHTQTAKTANTGSVNNSDLNNSYVITETEKETIKNLCRIINNTLNNFKLITDNILKKQDELKKLADSEAVQRLKRSLEYEISELIKEHNNIFLQLRNCCSDITTLLKNKTHINSNLKSIYDITTDISNDKYKVTSPAFRYNALILAISKFHKMHKLLICNIDQL